MFVWSHRSSLTCLPLPSLAACRVDSHTRAIRQPNRLFFAVGEKVVVLCKRGFKTSQDGNLTCQDDGNWDKNIPLCTGKLTINGVNEFLVSKETVVLRRWERSKQKFGFIKRVDKG